MPRDDRPLDRLAYEVNGDGESILFIHGSFMEDALRPIVDEPVLQDYRRIHYDRAGYGESPARDEDFSFKSGAADALDLIHRLDLGSAHVTFTNLEENLGEQVRKVRSHPWIPESITVRGFIYDVDAGRLSEVSA